ncbi:MAG: energy-coupling factor transporter transmembrane component T [Candidatus Rifleibacteriota bacterium]
MAITYSPAESFLYALNPLIKGYLALLFILMFSVLVVGPAKLSIILLMTLFAAYMGRVPLAPVLLSIKKIILLLLIVALIQGFAADTFNAEKALEAVLRIIGVFCVAGIFVSISSQAELLYFWESNFKPFTLIGLPARELALIMVIAVRFLPVILAEIDRIRMAQMARGAGLSARGYGLSAIKGLLPLLIPTLSLAIVRAGELALAMEARGYRISRERTRFRSFKIGLYDILAFCLSIVLLTAILFPGLFNHWL